MKIVLGPGGTAGLGYEKGLKEIAEFGLGALEVEFTYGVRMKDSEAEKIAELAKKLKISLSIHAPYYINLASKEKAKIDASKKRILDSCRKGHILKAKKIVFHAGFYQGRDPENIYGMIKEQVLDLQKTIKKNKWKVRLAPETTGKRSQFGSLDELLRLKKDTGCSICIDFSHLLARDNKIDYDKVFKRLKKFKNIHCHFSGIEYTEKGEKRHKITEEKRIKELIRYAKKYDMNMTIINESPQPFEDSVKTLDILKKTR